MYLQYSVITFSLEKKEKQSFFGISPLFDFLNIFLVFGGRRSPSRPAPHSACQHFFLLKKDGFSFRACSSQTGEGGRAGGWGRMHSQSKACSWRVEMKGGGS